MTDAASLLSRLCTPTRPGDLAFVLDRSEVISRLVSTGAAPDRETASLVLEKAEPELLETIFVGDWAIRYNVYTDRFHFDRLLPPDVLERVAEHHARRLHQSLGEALAIVTPRQFELLIGVLLNHAPGFRSVKVSKPTRDGGVDFSATLSRPDHPDTAVYGQAKHWKSPVGAPEVQKLIGVLAVKGRRAARVSGFFIALSGFTDPALRAINESPYLVEHWGLEELVSHMIDYGVGTQRVTIDCVVTDFNFWDELREL